MGRVAEEIGKSGRQAGPQGGLLLRGRVLAEPVLLSLAVEVALNPWQCRDRNGEPDGTHDLLKPFDGLGDEAKRQLQGRMPEVESPVRGPPPVHPGIRSVLERCGSVFVDWRRARARVALRRNRRPRGCAQGDFGCLPWHRSSRPPD